MGRELRKKRKMGGSEMREDEWESQREREADGQSGWVGMQNECLGSENTYASLSSALTQLIRAIIALVIGVFLWN